MDRPISWSEQTRIVARSQRIRADAIRVRVMSGHAFCSIVENQARREPREKARETMEKVSRLVDELARHLVEPRHLAAADIPQLLEELANLRERARRIEQTLLAPELPPPRGDSRNSRLRPGIDE